jgi:serine/threonine protein kinase
MTRHVTIANDERLHLSAADMQRLLADNEATGVADATAKHLESCETCQRQLATLAAEPHWWSDAQELLDATTPPRWQPDLSWTSEFVPASERASSPRHSSALDDHLTRLLAAPSHPEMLGRLGRYDIERVIGSGGMGIVLKAHDSELNRPIAIKLLAPHLSHVGAARERFAREGRAAAAVVHEHVVSIYNVEADGALPFLVMQYVPGRSLQARVDEDGPLGVEEILRIGMQAAAGLAAAHAQGLVHRDVKPSNILLEDTVERAVLTDFGLARAMDDASLTQTGIIAGTPHYMAPEQAAGDEIDARSDLFSLGAVLYFMAAGHPPFRAASALAVLHRICQEPHRPVWHWNKDVPEGLVDVIDRLLAKKPSRRFASAEEVRERLAKLLSDIQQHGLRGRSFAQWRGSRGRRKVIAACALVATTTAIGAATWLVPIWPTSSETPPPPSTAAIGAEVDAERDFQSNLEAARASLQSADATSAFLQNDDEAWRLEVESLNRDLDRLEF